ncbi:MAG: MG2 domain-containing protein, partial [Akkermansia sp.]|nr:MG2 domain-containing protein [Akkermansia sp.]
TGAGGMLQSGECLLRLDDAVGGTPAPGMYLLRLQPLAGAAVREAMGMNGQESDLLDAQVDVLVQVTDLNVMPGGGAVLVNRYSDGNPLESGVLTYQTAANDQCQIAVENGIAWLPPNFRARGALRVSCGADSVLVKDVPRGGRSSGVNRRGYSTLLVLDRPLYRPGDTVHVRGVLRRQQPDGSCGLPEEHSARVTISRPDGQMLEKREVPLGEFGAFEMDFSLPRGEDDVTGYYSLQVESGKFRHRGTVNCQVFRRDAFKVSLELELNPVAPSHYTVRVAAQDYSGVPLAGAACSLNIGGQSRTLELDAAGKAEITGEVTEEMRKAHGLSVRGSVSNDREEYVQVPPVHKPIYPADFYMTVQGGRLQLMDSHGTGVLKREQVVELKLVRTARDPEVGANGLGTMQSREQVLWSGSLTVPADCQTGQEMPLELLQKHSGAEAWKLSGRDAAGRETTLSCPIWRFQPDSPAPGLQVEHKDGELVLQADLPRAVKAHLFIGCGQKLRHQVLPVVAGPQTLRVPLQPGEEGNVCATLVLPGRSADEAPIVISEQCYVPVARYHLGVELQLPQQVCRPAETVSLSGRVLADGKPAEAEVTLYAVDAGMLSAGRYTIPDPESYFCRGGAAPGFSLHYSYARPRSGKAEIHLTPMPGFWQGDIVGEGCNLYRDEPPSVIVSAAGAPVQGRYYKRAAGKNAAMAVDREMAEETGFGGALGAPAPLAATAGAAQAAMPRLRTDFAPVALWKGALRTDAEGRFSAQVTLPDTLTTYRVFAVALDKSGKRFGSASGEFTVAQPVMLTPGTPLFMSLGDTLRLPLSIVNNTEEAGTWRVTLEGADAPQEITLEARQSGTLYFDFTATTEGGQKLRWVAQGKPGSDAVQGEFSVRFPAPVLKESHRLALSPGSAAVALGSLMGSDVAAASRGQMQLVASANPLLHLAGAADFLLAYPYGCTEQRASALIPWLLYQHLAPFCPLMAQTPAEEVKETVEEMVREILSRQCQDGGLSYWGGRRESCLWASAHAAYVLKLAQEQGYNVPQEQLDELIHYLSKADDEKLSVLARFCIARVRGRSGAMMDALREAPLPGSWARETRASMQFMLAMLENPAGADAAFRKWMRTAGRDYRHGSTQTHAWSLLALAEYIKLSRKSGGEAVLVLHDGAELQLGMGATEVPLPWQTGQEMKVLPTTLAAKQGTVYATLNLRALPGTTDYPGVTECGLQVTRLYEKKGADGIWRPASSFKVGDV